MPKNLFQDMVKAKRDRNGVSSAEPENKKIDQKISTKEEVIQKTSRQPIYRVGPIDPKRPKYMLWLVAALSLAVFLFAVSYLFSSAKISVNPRTEEINLNENLSASLGASPETLPFELIKISGEENKTIEAAGEKDFSLKSEGAALIYNTFSAAPQILNIDTRLEGSNGKIYKTAAKVTVPGVAKDGKPGSIEVKIKAAESGKEYNSAPLDFKIFGFKGTPKYSKFYGRGVGPITGGLKGKFPDISDDEKTVAISELKNTLRTELMNKAADQIPSGFILYEDAVFLSTDENNIDFTSFKENTLAIALHGTLSGILLNEDKLAKKITADNIEKYDGGNVYIPNIRDLTFSLKDKDSALFEEVKKIDFNLSGPAKIVWKLDDGKLLADLAGKSKKDFTKILLKYPNINSANLVLSPAWKMSIPDVTKKIKLIVNYPK